ncbi:hypothetical protein DFH07DRAFT_766824 [Mycena maculata]|uniref:Uncharacterized protein n=1 Tax=Mycena maculata TaxID=230809 RepID=A0AAD7K403_9AGAR|nr:hypothetical protein DFH07DRAFT_766824 [Mycena maculata]
MTLVNSDGFDDEEEDLNEMQEASENEEEESEEEEEGNEEEEVTMGKRKRAMGKKPAKEQPVMKKRCGPPKKSAQEPAEMKKSKSAKKPTKTAILNLLNSAPFNMLKAQILVRISAALHPAQEDYNAYDITFTVPRKITDPVTLDSEETYTHLIDHALQTNTAPCAKIVVEAKETRRSAKAGRKPG